MKLTAHELLAYIRRDPASWTGIAFSYMGPAQGKAALKIPDGAILVPGNRNNYGILGPALPDASIILPDIAQDWRVACGILETLSESSTNAGQEVPLRPISILVVEDDEMTSRLVTQHLAKYGTVLPTSNARKAVANYMVHKPDLVFLDIHYGTDTQNGFDVLTHLLSADPQGFVVMVSGDRDPATILKAFALGARGFIPKPLNATSFTRYLRAFHEHA